MLCQLLQKLVHCIRRPAGEAVGLVSKRQIDINLLQSLEGNKIVKPLLLKQSLCVPNKPDYNSCKIEYVVNWSLLPDCLH